MRPSFYTGPFQTDPMDPVRKSDRIGLLFTRDRSRTGTDRSNLRQTVPKHLDRFQGGHVNKSRSGPVQFGAIPVRSHVNVA